MEDIKEYLDIAYGAHDLHRFDAYVGPSRKNNIILSFVHGGAWRSDDKSQFDTLARRLVASVKCLVVVPNYRLTPRQPTPENALYHPAHAADILLFLGYLLTRPEPIGSLISREEPPRIYLIGHSCSAHILASIFLDSTRITPSLTPYPHIVEAVMGIICSEGIYDLDHIVAAFPEYRFVINTFGDHTSYADYSPVHYTLRDGTQHIRWFIIHSKGDRLVPMYQSRMMYSHLIDLYQTAEMPADEFVKEDMDVLEEQHDEIYTDNYIHMVTSFITGS